MDNSVLVIALQAIHLLFAIFWFGSLLYTELVLWPKMRGINLLAEVQAPLRNPSGRLLIAIPVVGTIVTGYARGAVDGVFDKLFTLYGLFFVIAAICGTSMIVWWASFPPRTMKTSWRMFYSGFWVLFALMLGLRFTA